MGWCKIKNYGELYLHREALSEASLCPSARHKVPATGVVYIFFITTCLASRLNRSKSKQHCLGLICNLKRLFLWPRVPEQTA